MTGKQPKVGIVIITYNIPIRVFLLQIEAINKFCKDKDFEIQIIDNSNIQSSIDSIKHHSSILALPITKTLACTTGGSESHSFAANISYKLFKDSYDYLFYIDHDCIPVKDFSVEVILDKKVAAGLIHGTLAKYFWPGCFMWNNSIIDKNLINFSPNWELKLDTGGELRRIIDKYTMKECISFDEGYCQNGEFTKGKYNFYTMIYNNTFIHFINGSGWNSINGQEDRINSLINIAREKIDGKA